MTTQPSDPPRATAPFLMQKRTAPRLPKMGEPGFLGAHGRDTRKAYGVEPNTDEQIAAFRRVEHERIEAQNDADYRQSLIHIFGKGKPADFNHQHAAIDAALVLAARDGRGRDTDHILTVAADEYVSLRTELPDFLEGQQAKMDAKQEPLEPKRKPNRATFSGPVTVPPPVAPPQSDAERDAETDAFFAGADAADAKPTPRPEPDNIHDKCGRRMLAEYGEHRAAIEFARATGRKDWKTANDAGLDDAMIAKMLEEHIAANPATVSKPAAKPPAHVETPAPVADVPAPRNDAPTAHAETIPAKSGYLELPPMPSFPVIGTISTSQLTGGAVLDTPRYEEWPFVALLTMYSPEGLEMKYTLRAASDAQLLDAERAFIARRLAAGYTTGRQNSVPLPQQAAPAPVPAAPVLPTAATPAPLTYAPLPETVATAPATGAPDKKGRVPGQTGVDKVTAIMRNETNGKTVIEIFCGGRWSDHKLRRDEDIALLRAAFPALDIAAMVAGTQYPINATCTWVVTSNLNDKGTYWRDVTAIAAA